MPDENNKKVPPKDRLAEAGAWARRHPFLGALVTLLLLLGIGLAAANVLDAMKVIDPSDPRFDPMKFRFEDYAGLQSDPEPKLLAPALLKMFPRGTEEAYFDEILVEQAGTQKRPSRIDPENAVVYRYSTLGGLSGSVITVVFDADRQSVDLWRGDYSLYNNQRVGRRTR